MSRFNLIGIEVDLKSSLIHSCIIISCILSLKSALIPSLNFLSIPPFNFVLICKEILCHKNRVKLEPNSVFMLIFVYVYKGRL